METKSADDKAARFAEAGDTRKEWGLSERERTGDAAYWREQYVKAFGKLNWLKKWAKHQPGASDNLKQLLLKELDALTKDSPLNRGWEDVYESRR